jgi:NAD(P)-dependent dehydrogenase (short-subunit alcohol dehydrogenase family)
MGHFDGKVAIVTGAGRGIGRCNALLLASEGASVVVNDLGCDPNGEMSDKSPAKMVVDEITAGGGKAVANFADVSKWDDARDLVSQAVDEFGRLDVLVNNAGFVRDRMSFNLAEEDWDIVLDGVLKGHLCPSRHAMAYWKAESKTSGELVNAKIVNTTSESGLYGNAGQSNYNAAKAGVAALTLTFAREGERIGVRSNAISPNAGTRLMGVSEIPADQWDPMAPANVAPVVAWLASDLSEGVNGQVVKIGNGRLQLIRPWHPITEIIGEKTWTIEEIDSFKGQLFAKSNGTGIFPIMPPVDA